MCPPEALTSLKASAPVEGIDDVVPHTEISQAAYAHAAALLHPSILAHSIRLYLYTKTLAAARNSIYHTDATKHDHLFIACLFHDIGTTETYNGTQRFEVEGADAAVAHLGKYDVSEEDKKQVWYTIAMHTTAGIVHRMGELPALMRRALEVEFGNETEVECIEDVMGLKARVERAHPREGIEKVLGDAVVQQAVKVPAKAPAATWPGALYKAYLEDPGWEGVNKGFFGF